MGKTLSLETGVNQKQLAAFLGLDDVVDNSGILPLLQQEYGTELGEYFAGLYPPLARRLDVFRQNLLLTTERKTLIVGVNGPQGSGKSTFVRILDLIFKEALNLKSVSFSLDDIYKTKAERESMGRIHPLFKTRGVPGTHDLLLGQETLRKLCEAEAGSRTRLPAFDKLQDDRLPPEEWPVFQGRPDFILFEGWCMGAQALSDSELETPLNSLEEQEDPQAVWRSYMNKTLGENYPALFNRLDCLVMLQAPGFEVVRDWRLKQEMNLEQKPGMGRKMNVEQVTRFVSYFERLTRSMHERLPGLAEILLELDEHQKCKRLHLN